jgi:hypothetical protein
MLVVILESSPPENRQRIRCCCASESKRALDAIPALISGWRQSFEHGLSTNAVSGP